MPYPVCVHFTNVGDCFLTGFPVFENREGCLDTSTAAVVSGASDPLRIGKRRNRTIRELAPLDVTFLYRSAPSTQDFAGRTRFTHARKTAQVPAQALISPTSVWGGATRAVKFSPNAANTGVYRREPQPAIQFRMFVLAGCTDNLIEEICVCSLVTAAI